MRPPPAAPGAILFDWDDTLIDGWVAIAAALNAVFARHAMPTWTPAQARANVRGSLRDTFPAMFGPEWQKDAALFYATLKDEHLAHLAALPGARELLDAGRGLPLGVVSNKTGRFLRAEVAHLGWEGRFGAVVGAGDAAADKPDPAPLLLALRQLDVPAGPAVWMVGDTALDMQAGRAAGCRTILLGTAAQDGGVAVARPDERHDHADALARHLRALRGTAMSGS